MGGKELQSDGREFWNAMHTAPPYWVGQCGMFGAIRT